MTVQSEGQSAAALAASGAGLMRAPGVNVTGMCLIPPMKLERRICGLPCHVHVGDAPHNLVENEAQLHPGQVGAEAEVGSATAEGDVRVRGRG